MPRRPRRGTGGLIFHVFNRAAWHGTLFDTPADFDAFERVLAEAVEREPIRLVCYVAMPTHFHLVLMPVHDDSMSTCLHWLTTTHAERWRVASATTGRGAVYQGRFKAIPVQDDGHFLRLCRYVERNPVRRELVVRAEDWRWGSAWQSREAWQPRLHEWPVPKPSDWNQLLAAPDKPRELAVIRTCINRDIPFGDRPWRDDTFRRLNLSPKRPTAGRPRLFERVEGA